LDADSDTAVDSNTVVTVETVDGSRHFSVARLDALEANSEFTTLRLPAGAETGMVPAEDVLFLRLSWDEAAPQGLKLADGGTLHFAVLLRNGDELWGSLQGGGQDAILLRTRFLSTETLSLALSDVKGWFVIHPRGLARDLGASGQRERRLRRRILEAQPAEDVVFLREGGEIRGLLEKIGDSGIELSTEALGDVEGTLRVPYPKQSACVLAAAEDFPETDIPETEPPAVGNSRPDAESSRVVRMVLRDGSRLRGSIRQLNRREIVFAHDLLGELTVKLQDVLEVAFLGGRARYLSDHDPSRTKEHLGAAFSLEMPFQRDLNVLGGPMRMGGRTHEKGLGVHAYSKIEYPLNGGFRRFQATVGLDDSAHPTDPETAATEVASVVFRVHLDGRQIFEKALTWKSAPLTVNLPVNDGKILALEVDFGGQEGSMNFALDRANWADARIIK